MATALRATKLTMMATTTTMATGDNNDNGDGATGDCATGYNNNNDGARQFYRASSSLSLWVETLLLEVFLFSPGLVPNSTDE